MSRPRPLSPHLTIYKPQISSVLSILHRLTGAAIYLGALVLVWWLVDVIYHGFEPQFFLWPLVTVGWGKILLFLWSWAFFYHFSNGIRHLVWDAGYGYGVKTMTITGIVTVVSSIALTGLCWVIYGWGG